MGSLASAYDGLVSTQLSRQRLKDQMRREREKQRDIGYRQQTPGYSEYASGAISELFPTPIDTLASMQIPGLSDAAGFASDLGHMYQDPSQRSWGNLGMAAAGALPFVPSGLIRRTLPDPEKVLSGYRALRLFKSRPGETFPAMINRGISARDPAGDYLLEGIPLKQWLQADYLPTPGLKPRKGWHAGELPYAPQFHHTRGEIAGMQPSNMVWADVSLQGDRNWQAEADKLGNPMAPYYRSELPEGTGPDGGFYRYRNRPEDPPWIISDAVRHNRLMTDEEVADILRQYGIEPTPRAGGPWTLDKLNQFGFGE